MCASSLQVPECSPNSPAIVPLLSCPHPHCPSQIHISQSALYPYGVAQMLFFLQNSDDFFCLHIP